MQDVGRYADGEAERERPDKQVQGQEPRQFVQRETEDPKKIYAEFWRIASTARNGERIRPRISMRHASFGVRSSERGVLCDCLVRSPGSPGMTARMNRDGAPALCKIA